MPRTVTTLGLLLATLAGTMLVGCQSPIHRDRFRTVGDPPSYFRGSLTYTDDATIPEGSTVTARLLNVSDPGASPVVIATDSYETHSCACCASTCESGSKKGACSGSCCGDMSRPPFAFFIRYDALKTPPGGAYAVDASITDANGRVLYTSAQTKVISPNERIHYFDMPMKAR